MRIDFDIKGWRKEQKKLTVEDREKLTELDRIYYLAIEDERRKRRIALSKMPRDRLLD